MIDTSTLLAFVIASAVLTVIPGPAVLYIAVRSVEGGRLAGLVSAVGISVGGFVHIAFAAVGLSAILASSAVAFSIVKWAGVAYLIYLGLSRIFGRDEEPGAGAVPEQGLSLRSVFRQGVIVEILNPKVALFFLAFLPQFVNPASGAAWVQIVFLGLVYTIVALFTDSIYAILGGTARGWMQNRESSPAFRRRRRYLVGGIYLALGATAALWRRTA